MRWTAAVVIAAIGVPVLFMWYIDFGKMHIPGLKSVWKSTGDSDRDKVSNTTSRATPMTVGVTNSTCASCGGQFSGSETSPLPPGIHLPHPQAYKDFTHEKWVRDLRNLTALMKRVILLEANKKFQHVLINWLIAAFVTASPTLPGIDNVIILVFDHPELHKLLSLKGFHSIHLEPTRFIKSAYEGYRRRSIWLGRMAIVRMLNYWGIETLLIDADAIVLHNPLPLFEVYAYADIVGSVGVWEEPQWAVCMGVILFRSNLRIGEPSIMSVSIHNKCIHPSLCMFSIAVGV